jgi:hypothetical protein
VGLNLSAATALLNSRKIYLKNIYSAKKLLNNWQIGTVRGLLRHSDSNMPISPATNCPRYLTNRPKTQAGQELRLISNSLTRQTEKSFVEDIDEWHKKWRLLLAERTSAPDGKHWWYTHRQLRAAYRSLHTNMPYLFSSQRHPELRIPNTNNSLEGYFSHLKALLNNHHGLRRWRRYRMIEAVLNNPPSS